MPDADQRWVRAVRAIAWYEFGLVSPAIDENSSTTFAEGAIPHVPTAITIFPREISDFGIVGLNIAPNHDDDGNIAYAMIDCPYDLDPDYDVGIRIKYTQSAVATDGTTWKAFIAADKKDALIQNHNSATLIKALDVLITEKNSTKANELLITSRGVRNSIGLTRNEIEDGASLRLNIEADVIDANQDNVTLFSVLLDYVPRRSVGSGSGSGNDRPLHANEVG